MFFKSPQPFQLSIHVCIFVVYACKLLPDELTTFLQTQAEVALAAADGDPNVAIEILMSQEVCMFMFANTI
jgi:hypothetical protein